MNRIRAIQWFTIFWMFLELIVSGISAWRAHSPALLAFGGDSGIELPSACVVLWHFRSPSTRDQTQKTSAQIAAGLLFLLAAFVLVASVGSLMGHIETRPSRLGIGLLLTASVVMPWLARQKRRLSGATASGSFTSRRGTIRLVRVHGMDCAGRTNPQCHMEYRLGRPRCRVGFDSLDSSRRVGDRERQTLLLFLSTTRSDGSVLWQRRVNRPQSQCLFIGLLALVGR